MELLYIPVLRSRQQEDIVLKSFDFGNQIYPLIEIFKEHDRGRKTQKKFEDIYIPLIDSVKANRVFIDFPTYLNEQRNTKTEIISFSKRVLSRYDKSIEYMLRLSPLSDKIIPVISSFIKRDQNHRIVEQEDAFRDTFKSLAFRISINGFYSFFGEVKKVIKPQDYLIIDFETVPAYVTPSLREIIDEIKAFQTCPVIIIRSSINTDVQNVGLDNGEIVTLIDNGLLENFKTLGALAFGDYAGVKKDDMTEGGGISPGFLYFNASKNNFVGFKGKIKKLDEFEDTIVPAVLSSSATLNMQASGIPYLSPDNLGWSILNSIANKLESGKSQSKFKRIAIEHYLHCIKVMIENNII